MRLDDFLDRKKILLSVDAFKNKCERLGISIEGKSIHVLQREVESHEERTRVRMRRALSWAGYLAVQRQDDPVGAVKVAYARILDRAVKLGWIEKVR